MGRHYRVRSNRRLRRLPSELHVYSTCVLPVLLYGSETRTLLMEDVRKLQSFEMRCQRRLLRVCWSDVVTNGMVSESTSLAISETSSPEGATTSSATSWDSRQTFQPSWPSGHALGAVHKTPGSSNSKRKAASRKMNSGRKPGTATSGWLYDPAPVLENDDDETGQFGSKPFRRKRKLLLVIRTRKCH